MKKNPRDLALELAVATLIIDLATARKDALREQLAQALDSAGADATRAEIDGQRLAKVSLIQPKPKASVTDELAFTNYVESVRPDEVVIRVQVRESYKKHLLDGLTWTETGEAVNPETGEVIPGVRFASGSSYVSLRFEKDGRDNLSSALHSGVVALPDITAPKSTALTTSEEK